MLSYLKTVFTHKIFPRPKNVTPIPIVPHQGNIATQSVQDINVSGQKWHLRKRSHSKKNMFLTKIVFLFTQHVLHRK